MKNFVLCVTLNFLFFINTAVSINLTAREKIVVFAPKGEFTLACIVSEKDGTPEVVWYKDDNKVADIEGLKTVMKYDESNNIVTLTVNEPKENAAGNYTCSTPESSDSIEVRRRVLVKVQANINVVEEEKLRLHCKVLGHPTISWVFLNETYTESSGRVTVENYTEEGKTVINGALIVTDIKKEDRGNVTCIGVDLISNTSDASDCMVRVKDKYAALWPFIGICAEVIALCAIIIIYEKKRNKTELEESDTDQSPDQKNTPDHGKDANLRHRQ